MVAGRPADGVDVAVAGKQSVGSGERGADRLAGGGDEGRVDRDVGLEAGRGELRHHGRLLARGVERRHVIGAVERGQSPLDRRIVGHGVDATDAEVAAQADPQLGQPRVGVAPLEPRPAFADPHRTRVEPVGPLLDHHQLAHRSAFRIRGPRRSKPLAR